MRGGARGPPRAGGGRGRGGCAGPLAVPPRPAATQEKSRFLAPASDDKRPEVEVSAPSVATLIQLSRKRRGGGGEKGGEGGMGLRAPALRRLRRRHPHPATPSFPPSPRGYQPSGFTPRPPTPGARLRCRGWRRARGSDLCSGGCSTRVKAAAPRDPQAFPHPLPPTPPTSPPRAAFQCDFTLGGMGVVGGGHPHAACWPSWHVQPAWRGAGLAGHS